MRRTRYDIAVKIGTEQIAQICFDMEVTDDYFNRAKAILRACTDDAEAYADVFSKGVFRVRIFND